MKRTKYTAKDFAWTGWNAKQLESHYIKIIEQYKDSNARVLNIGKNDRTFENTIFGITCGGEFVNEDNVFSFLANISSKASLRKKAEELEQKFESFTIQNQSDPKLYQAAREYFEGNYKKEKARLRPEDRKLVEDLIKNYEYRGLSLPLDKQKQATKLLQKMRHQENLFMRHLNGNTDHILIDKDDVAGLPDNLVAQLPIIDGKYQVDLSYPIAYPFLHHADNKFNRKKMADKLAAKGGKTNLKRMVDLVHMRYEFGLLMGRKTFADYQIEPKMAKDADEVREFSLKIINSLKKKFALEKKELEAYKRRVTGDSKAKIEYYDGAYYVNKMIKEQFQYDPEEARAYFPLSKVISGTFGLMDKLFSLKFKKTNFPSWHKDAWIYEVSRREKIMGYIGLDLFPRQGKYAHVCQFPILAGRETGYRSGKIRTPFGAILGQFPKPTKSAPSLLSFREVQTFLHEFGHLMHQITSEAVHQQQSGSNTAFDFVELPSQMFENWASDLKVLQGMSEHYQTGRKIPKELFEKIEEMERFRQATRFTHQAITQLYDIEIHSQKPIADLNGLMRDMLKKYTGEDDFSVKSLFPASFSHLCNPLYIAGYYGYMWALVYAHDCFSVFRKNGITDKKTAKSFEKEILAVGSSRPEAESLRKFLGRKPSEKAFLKAIGVE